MHRYSLCQRPGQPDIEEEEEKMQVADGNDDFDDDETCICASFYWKVYLSIHISAATCFLFSHDLIISISQAVAFALFRTQTISHSDDSSSHNP